MVLIPIVKERWILRYDPLCALMATLEGVIVLKKNSKTKNEEWIVVYTLKKKKNNFFRILEENTWVLGNFNLELHVIYLNVMLLIIYFFFLTMDLLMMHMQKKMLLRMDLGIYRFTVLDAAFMVSSL